MVVAHMGKSYNVSSEIPSAEINNTISVEDLPPFVQAMQSGMNAQQTFFDGDKFYGGFGETKLFLTDYWTLRQRSSQLFEENLYARGLIRRLITNEINTGLSLESTPGDLLGLDDTFKNEWAEDVEARFQIWAKNPFLCDYKQKKTFGALQREIRQEALVTGDILVVLRMSKVTNLPQIELISGSSVQTPLGFIPRRGNKIIHGVELDARGRQVAFHIRQNNGISKRVAAFGERSGKKIAWLVYGTDKRLDAVRGQPLLALILQSLKEIDRNRDAVQRKALLNSILALFIKKTKDKMGTKPVSGGALRRDAATVTDSDGKSRSLNIAKQIPGVFYEELQEGEEPVPHSTAGTDINFGPFEATIINAIAWSNEVPPEILTLAFSSNYSASRGAVSEFKMYLNKSRSEFAEAFTEPVYIEWLLSEVLKGKITAPGLLEAWQNPNQYDTFGAWISSDWAGAIKPNVDLQKEAKGYKILVNEGWIDNDRSSKELTGTKFSKNIKRITQENKLKADAMRPLLDLEREFPESKIFNTLSASAPGLTLDAIADVVQEGLENNAPKDI